MKAKTDQRHCRYCGEPFKAGSSLYQRCWSLAGVLRMVRISRSAQAGLQRSKIGSLQQANASDIAKKPHGRPS